MSNKPIEVVFYQRKPRKYGNFSLEIVFDAVRRGLPKDIKGIKNVVKYESLGLWKRVAIALQAIRQQGDVNHITGDIYFAGIFLQKKKTVLTYLDIIFMKHPNPIARAILRFFWISLPINRAQIVTSISQATKDEVLKQVNCDPNKIMVVYVPISNRFVPVPKPFNAEKPVILQLGCAENKNLARLIEAIKDIPCHLEIVGKPPIELQQKLKEYQISHFISWNISEEEVMEKYIQSDIVSLISTYEGFGMPIVEANAIGRVCITANILSMPEVGGEAAHYVDPFDIEDMKNGFLTLIQDHTYREGLIAKGFINRERFTEEKIAADYAAIYRKLQS